MQLSTQESCGRGTQLFAFRSAVLELWGEFGWREVASALSAEAKLGLFDKSVQPLSWIPERYMMELAEAIFAGPVDRDEDVYRTFVGTMMDRGFGRIRRFLVRHAPPERLLDRAPALWRHDHTQGELTVAHEGSRARVLLRDHVHATTELTRLTACEVFRHALSQTRARDVRGRYRLDEQEALEVVLEWR